MPKSHIWVINQYSGSPQHGRHLRFYEVAKEWIHQGHTVTIITATFSHLLKNPIKTQEPFQFEVIDGIDYVWVKTPSYKGTNGVGRLWNMLVFFLNLWRLPIHNLKAPQKIIVSAPSPFPILQAKRWKKRFNATLIYDVRDLWPLTFIEVVPMSPYHPVCLLFGLFEKIACRSADWVTSTLKNSHLYLQKKGLNPQKFKYIPMGYKSGVSSPSPDWVKTARLPKHKLFMYVGSLSKANHVDFFLEGINQLESKEQIQCWVIGDGEEANYLKKKYAHNPKISFHGFVDAKMVPSLLEAADAVYKGNLPINLYAYGLSPVKLAEYMYYKRVIIHATNTQNDPVSESKCGIVVDPNDINALKNAILKVANLTDKERNTMGENGQAYAKRHFNYGNIAKEYASLET